MSAIEFNSVSEKYRIKFIKEKKVSWQEIWALKDISFEVDKGEVLGVIGENGAGKTTLLKLIAGMLIPDKGKVGIQGRVSTLMELGAGFNPEFSGRENILINARIYGLDEEKIQQKIEEIIEFAGLHRFIDAPIKYYSQGMYMRLAFALAIYVEPDTLLIDDILAVGDQEAQQKCIKKILELKQTGKTIVVVSHDMHMINKLCSRVILLEKGGISKEGSPEKVTQYYLETVGDKRGIAVLEEDKLRIVFNNGKMNISYADTYLTKDNAGCLSYFVPSSKIWLSSSSLYWQIKSLLPNTIIAEGKTADEALSQIWTLKLEKDYLKCEVEVKEDQAKEAHMDFFFASQYKEWLTLDNKGVFPSFIHKLNWQDLGLSGLKEGFLGFIPGPETQNYPFILQRGDENNQTKLLNTGYEQEARVIQIFSDNNRFISMGIRVFGERDRFEDYIEAEKQKFFLKEREEAERLRASCTISSGYLRIFADLENKTVRVHYKDKEVTRGKGLYSSFYAANKWFLLDNAQWRIQKSSEKELILTFIYESLSLSQVLTLNCKDENTLIVKFEIETAKPIPVDNWDIRLELPDKYNDWLTAHEGGDFSINQYVNDIAPIRLRESKVSQVILRPDVNNRLPVLFFESSLYLDRQILSIYKRKEESAECICLNFSQIIPKKGEEVKAGRQAYFAGNLVIDKEVKLEGGVITNGVELNSGNLRLIFDQGRGKLFWGGRELTTGLGIYTSVRSRGVWYDSYQAVWQQEEKDKDKIIISGSWPYIPILQKWQFKLIDKNSILWKVEMEIYEEINLEIEQANIMLSSDYKNWLISGTAKGEFIDEYTQDYDILPFRFWYGRPAQNEIGVVDNKLPSISLKSNLKNDNFRGIIENTDYLYKARLLQYQKSNIARLLPKKYTYFEGEIKIGVLKK